MVQVVTMGELLIDFSFTSNSKRGYPLYEANPGGAPANVAIGVRRLGAGSAFIGKIGGDALSAMLRRTLEENGVGTRGLVTDPARNVALAMVSLDEKGDRSFNFYRRGAADVNMTAGEVDTALIASAKAFHFGSVALTDEPSRSAVRFAAKTAREKGVLVSYDPNYRPLLWESENAAVAEMKAALPLCDVLKVSEEELALLSGESEIDAGMRRLLGEYGMGLIFATLGAKGCRWLFRAADGMVEAGGAEVYDVKTVDTNGAGDSFIAAALYSLVCTGGGREALTARRVAEAADFASAASSLATAVTGAIPAMPTLGQVEALRGRGRRMR